MLKARLHDGSLLMDWYAGQRSHFWKDQPFKDYEEFRSIIVSKERDNEKYFWIQFPKPHSLATPNEFLDAIQGLERYSWFKNYLFNIEFNPHIHSHLIISNPNSDVRPNRIINNIGKHLGINKNHIECKRYGHSYHNRCSYVKGLKISAEKQHLVKLDIADRKIYNIREYYSDAPQSDKESQSSQS